MIFTHGDIFESGCDLLVNPVNCVGISGRGLARDFAAIFAECIPAYQRACHRHELRPGRILVVGPVVFLPTKRHWRDQSRLDDVDAGLATLATYLNTAHRCRSIAIPPLGCGLGGLRWTDVRPLIELHLRPIEAATGLTVTVFEP